MIPSLSVLLATVCSADIVGIDEHLLLKTQTHGEVEDTDDMLQLQLQATTGSIVAKGSADPASEENTASEEENACWAKFAEVGNNVLACMADSQLRDAALMQYYEDYYSVSPDNYMAKWLDIAEGEALSIIRGKCDPIKDLGLDFQEVSRMELAAQMSVKHVVDLWIDVLEDPRTDLYIAENFGSDALAAVFNEGRQVFGEVCESNSEDFTEIKSSCRDHMNLEAFLHAMVGDEGVESCAEAHADLLQKHVKVRHSRNHRRARLVQVLHSKDNKLADHFELHLKHGGSERHMEYLIAAAALGNLSARQRHLLQHIDHSTPHHQLHQDCSKWSAQRDDFHLDQDLKENVLLNSAVFRSYMDCLCADDQPKIVCQAEFMRDQQQLSADIQDRHRQLLTESDTASQHLAISDAQSNMTAWPPGIGPCVFQDAFSCEVCLGSGCMPFGTPRNKGRKNTADEDPPWIIIKNALTASATDFKIGCTACAALTPGEQISFELEMALTLNGLNLDTLFSTAKITVDAKTCIGGGSPLRVIFDTLGITACKSNLKAEYMPFIGDFNIAGAIPGPVTGTWFEAGFDTRVHDPPAAVTAYCTPARTCGNMHYYGYTYITIPGLGRFTFPELKYGYRCTGGSLDTACYNRYKNMAGPQTLTGGVTVPLYVTDDKFWIVKVEGPANSGPRWKVELFQMPFDDVAQAIKDLWDNHAGPAIESALNDAGGAATAAGEWTVGAANSAGEWTVGAAEDVGQFGSDAVDTVGDGLNTLGQGAGQAATTVYNVVSPRRRGGRRRSIIHRGISAIGGLR